LTANDRGARTPQRGRADGDQSGVAALLADPETHGLPAGRTVRRIDTHASMVFLAGERALKVKRAVGFPYMDFSTLEKRRTACAAELRLNRRTAPQLYRGVRPILQEREGLRLGALQPDGPDPAEPDADVVEWAVELARFDEDALLDRVATAGRLDDGTVDALADAVAAFHAAAEPVDADPEALAQVIAENAAEFPDHPELFPPVDVDALTRQAKAAFEAVRGRLAQRAAAGLVRRCHGDLHLRNVVLIDGAPTLFDAIEFNDRIACIDVLYDLAFLVMDLDMRGLRAAANRLLTRYCDARDEVEGLAALPLFLSLRAAIRAKVTAAALAAQSDPARRDALAREAQGYFAAARRYLETQPPRLVAIGGVSGSGKTTVARALAPQLGDPPGALLVRSDVERKRLFGVAETERLPESAYRGKVNADVYQAMLARARRALQAGRSAVIEATFLDRSSRADARKLAESLGVPFQGVWLQAPAETLKTRVAARRGDASDATPEIVDAQLSRAPRGEIAWPALDAAADPDELAAQILARLTGAD
jgi:hypothetical protein